MEKLNLPNNLRSSMTWGSETCEVHNIRKMMMNGEEVCPRCWKEQNDREFEKKINEEIYREQSMAKYNTLLKKSLVDDETILKARIYNFTVQEEEEIQNKHTVEDCIKRFLTGEIFNLVLQGNQGAGKSHLAYSVLHDINETRLYSCLFISVDKMLRLIRASFRDKESTYSEGYFTDLLSKADFLVLDDLGAESGAIDTEKSATDFVQRVLYGITNARQEKATIITTNLSGPKLFEVYDKKLVSRLMKNAKPVVFKTTKDKRWNLPF